MAKNGFFASFCAKNTPKSPHNPRYLFPAKNWADILFKYRISAFLTEYSHLKVCSTISDQRTTSDRRIFAHKLAIESLIKNEEIQFGPFFNFGPGATFPFCPQTSMELSRQKTIRHGGFNSLTTKNLHAVLDFVDKAPRRMSKVGNFLDIQNF